MVHKYRLDRCSSEELAKLLEQLVNFYEDINKVLMEHKVVD